MKKEIHPTYYEDTKVTCACGNTFTVGSTMKEIQIETCSACHPFYTGKEKTLERIGRVQQFRERQSKARKPKATPKAKAASKSEDKDA